MVEFIAQMRHFPQDFIRSRNVRASMAGAIVCYLHARSLYDLNKSYFPEAFDKITPAR
ncbi:hypothetical protein AWB82_06819 [Caballeronia glebae]|uniref:Uncharacterized protein n=1 Tax=Caballeronia glebae TaxID=1777143 RepID=A0A158DIW5_9BURK|nr:hypothetical protein [Caballeronia glebae]SAK94581.1 hypothetical protein AWB82_06819 [Caballeronia glebae]